MRETRCEGGRPGDQLGKGLAWCDGDLGEGIAPGVRETRCEGDQV